MHCGGLGRINGRTALPSACRVNTGVGENKQRHCVLVVDYSAYSTPPRAPPDTPSVPAAQRQATESLARVIELAAVARTV